MNCFQPNKSFAAPYLALQLQILHTPGLGRWFKMTIWSLEDICEIYGKRIWSQEIHLFINLINHNFGGILTKFYYTFSLECCSRGGRNPAFCVGGPCLKSGDQLSWLGFYQENSKIVQVRPQLPSTCFPIHYSIILLSNAMYCQFH